MPSAAVRCVLKMAPAQEHPGGQGEGSGHSQPCCCLPGGDPARQEPSASCKRGRTQRHSQALVSTQLPDQALTTRTAVPGGSSVSPGGFERLCPSVPRLHNSAPAVLRGGVGFGTLSSYSSARPGLHLSSERLGFGADPRSGVLGNRSSERLRACARSHSWAYPPAEPPPAEPAPPRSLAL